MSAPRFLSYGNQLAAITEAKPRRVLEVGVGSAFVKQSLEHFGVEVVTLDIQETLAPDMVGSVTEIPAEGASFDVASCCQVLEHLPFDQVGAAVSELLRVAPRLVMSVPDVSRTLNVTVRGWHASIPLPYRQRPMPADREQMGHKWEIGFDGTPLRTVRGVLEQQGRIVRSWRVPENPWHRFFVLVPK
jgi:hypothetical protein